MEITPASEWRKPREEGVIVKLPSGKNIKLRPVALDRLMVLGSIPDLLSPLAGQMLWSEVPVTEIISDPQAATNFTNLVNQIVPLAIMEPTVVPDGQQPSNDEIRLEDIGFSDKFAIFQIVIQPAEVLASFRHKQVGSLEPIRDGEDVGDTAEQPAPAVG
jgi:hypothetical protein